MSVSAPGLMYPNKDKNMILVTGGFGFIGSHFVRNTANLGLDIIIVDDLTKGEKFNYLKDIEIKDYYDVDDFLGKEYRRFPFWSRIRHIYHFGAISSTTAWNGKEVMKYNYEFSRDLYNEARHHKIGFTFISSASVYGNNENHMFSGFDEGHSTNPLNLYAYSKIFFENYMMSSKMEKAQIFRPFNVYGLNEGHKGDQASPITKFKKEVEETGTIEIFEGSDKIYRDFICVDDVVKIITTFPKDKTGIYNLGTGNVESFQRVADLIAEKFDGNVTTIPFPEHLKGRYQYFTKANTVKLIKALEYEYPFTTVEKYVKEQL